MGRSENGWGSYGYNGDINVGIWIVDRNFTQIIDDIRRKIDSRIERYVDFCIGGYTDWTIRIGFDQMFRIIDQGGKLNADKTDKSKKK